MAVSIVQHPDASVAEKVGAGAYIATEAVAHTVAVAGSVVAGVGCLTGAGTAICAGAGTAATAVSADGDPTNEVTMAANGVSNAVQAVSADGDPTNEAQAGIRLYRAVSNGEFQQLMETGKFQSVAESADGKYFATTIEHAGIWGERMMGAENFKIIQVDVSAGAASQFMYWNKLDWIGPAYYATLEQIENAYWNIAAVIQ